MLTEKDTKSTKRVNSRNFEDNISKAKNKKIISIQIALMIAPRLQVTIVNKWVR